MPSSPRSFRWACASLVVLTAAFSLSAKPPDLPVDPTGLCEEHSEPVDRCRNAGRDAQWPNPQSAVAPAAPEHPWYGAVRKTAGDAREAFADAARHVARYVEPALPAAEASEASEPEEPAPSPRAYNPPPECPAHYGSGACPGYCPSMYYDRCRQPYCPPAADETPVSSESSEPADPVTTPEAAPEPEAVEVLEVMPAQVETLTAQPVEQPCSCPYLQQKACEAAAKPVPAGGELADSVLDNLEKLTKAARLYQRGERAQKNGHWDRAKDCYEKSATLCPGSRVAGLASERLKECLARMTTPTTGEEPATADSVPTTGEEPATTEPTPCCPVPAVPVAPEALDEAVDQLLGQSHEELRRGHLLEARRLAAAAQKLDPVRTAAHPLVCRTHLLARLNVPANRVLMVRPALVPHVYARPAFAVAVPPVRMRVVLPPVDPNLLGAMERLWKEHHGLPTTGEEPAEEPTVGPQSALPPAGWDVPVDLGQWQSVRPLALPCVEMDPAAGRVRFAAGGPSVRLSGGSIHWEGPALLPPSAVAGAVTGWFNLFGGQMSAESDIRPIEYRIEIRD